MNSNNIVDMFLEIAAKIESEKEYVTELDSVLGDGDHWVNINKGYQKIVSMEDKLRTLALNELFRTVGMSLMSTVGGSSGVLYGDAFITASKTLVGVDDIDLPKGAEVLKAALDAMMKRGKAKPGDKTMIDPLYQVVTAYEEALEAGAPKEEVAKIISDTAKKGMNDTKDMVAQKGRATYRQDKGVGYIDAGAATMYYQLDIIGKHIAG
ncbi:dihydroxyacetone kinase, C-terminal domain [Dethiosulfatibacter aminovorans DSM 17477]|uniref:phosphoenolpyruvate--glycerone phosphotransferase n=1 Tax=Dethiosulfatibacter aminovorans DSM 17477 TaxID=1121476 RepID=A0A1M6M164_9FIRM|nr:dihydroxyacetone kinase subunit DhaL [Dethiosulfatibacter aminovorans]SHJ77237.1 dihydroxyacetone kinase, C-terminal domain [Dethiosulfatibacter aminovorans DSM 17477]